MDDLMLNCSLNKSNLLSLKGKDWSSLQNLESDDSEENLSEFNFNHQNGYLNGTIEYTNEDKFTSDDKFMNDKYANDKYTTNSSDDSLAITDRSTKHQQDTTKLNKEDMNIFGLRPAYDQFYLVVCEFCKKVFKPQALSNHIENRHSNGNETNHSSLINRLNIKQDENLSIENDQFSSANNIRSLLSNSSSLLANSSKDDLERMKHHPTTSKLKTSSNSSSSNSTTASSSPLTLSDSNNLAHTIKPRTAITKPKLLPCKDRKYDADKHCGVRLTEDAQPCTRSLTCKTHSLTLRRAVQGRRDSFDKLLVEHRLAKEAALRAAGVEVKPTKLQLKQQQRLLKNNQLLKDNASSVQVTSPFSNQSILTQPNQTSITNLSSINKATINKTVQPPIQLKIHLQSPNHTLSSSPFKAFNQLHQTESNTATTPNLNSTTTAIQSPSFVNINNLQFTSPSPSIKQFTFSNNQQLTRLLSSPSRTISNNQQPNNIPLPSSIQVINQTNNSLNHSNYNSSLNSQTTLKPFICDLNPATLNHFPQPAAVCTFNERRLSIYTQSSNKKILSSKLFNRKQDYAYSALSVFCNKEKSTMLNDQNEQLNTPVKTKIKLNCSQSNSRSDSRDFSSSNSNNSQDSLLQVYSPFDQKRSFDRNGLFTIEQKR